MIHGFILTISSYEKEPKQIILAGRVNKRTNVAGLIFRLVEELRKKWKNTMIVIRGDSMFCSHEVMTRSAQQG